MCWKKLNLTAFLDLAFTAWKSASNLCNCIEFWFGIWQSSLKNLLPITFTLFETYLYLLFAGLPWFRNAYLYIRYTSIWNVFHLVLVLKGWTYCSHFKLSRTDLSLAWPGKRYNFLLIFHPWIWTLFDSVQFA